MLSSHERMRPHQALVLQASPAKIQEQAARSTTGFQVVDNLRLLASGQAFKSLHLNDDFIKAKKVGPIPRIEPLPTIANRQLHRTREQNSALHKLNSQGFLMDRLKKTVPKFTMHGHGRADNRKALLITTHKSPPIPYPQIESYKQEFLICENLRNLRTNQAPKIGSSSQSEAARCGRKQRRQTSAPEHSSCPGRTSPLIRLSLRDISQPLVTTGRDSQESDEESRT